MTRTAVITGATSGIGAAYAKRLAADGYNLILTGRREELIRKLAEELATQYAVKVDVIIAELSDDSDIRKVMDIVDEADDIEFLINNAGYSGYLRHFIDSDVAEHERMVKVHQIVPMRLISLVAPKMIARGRGNIINVSSSGAFTPLASVAVYAATKAFLKTYSEALHQELMNNGIVVQALCPGATDTNFMKDYLPEEGYEKMMQSFQSMAKQPEFVVDYSLKNLKKRKTVCIPGLLYKAMVVIFPRLPKRLYYKLGEKMTNLK